MDKKIQDKINECIENFNFEQVKKVMDFLDWKWLDEVPSMGQIMLHAQDYLNRVADKLEQHEEYTISSGGIKVWGFIDDDGEIQFKLSFILAEWDTY